MYSHNHNDINSNTQYADRLCCSGTNGLLTSWLQSIVTRGKRHNSYYADRTIWPHQQRILRCLWSLSVEIQKNSTLRLYGPPSILNWFFFKILKFSGPSLSGMTSSTLLPHFLFGGLFWQMVIVISFARECKTVLNDYAPELLTRIVQNPTKLNDKI